MSPPPGPNPVPPRTPRCVLLVGETAAVPSSLVSALDRRGLDIRIVRHAPHVMAELAELYASPAAASPRTPPQTAQPPGPSLVIVEPQHQPRFDELRDAVTTYYPQVRTWRYLAHDPNGRPLLEAYPHPEPPSPDRQQHAQQQRRSLIVSVDAPPAETQDPLVSEDELAMLLAPADPPPAQPAS
ncbi:MAG: hypothetical protein AAGG38_10040 [Planctomycetota bacterium]